MLSLCLLLLSQTLLPGQGSAKRCLLRPDRVFDGREVHENWAVLVEGISDLRQVRLVMKDGKIYVSP